VVRIAAFQAADAGVSGDPTRWVGLRNWRAFGPSEFCRVKVFGRLQVDDARAREWR